MFAAKAVQSTALQGPAVIFSQPQSTATAGSFAHFFMLFGVKQDGEIKKAQGVFLGPFGF